MDGYRARVRNTRNSRRWNWTARRTAERFSFCVHHGWGTGTCPGPTCTERPDRKIIYFRVSRVVPVPGGYFIVRPATTTAARIFYSLGAIIRGIFRITRIYISSKYGARALSPGRVMRILCRALFRLSGVAEEL